MRIEIFVVLASRDKKTEVNFKCVSKGYYNCPNAKFCSDFGCRHPLEILKREMTYEFGGLTESSEEIGYWNDKDKIYEDIVKRWIIYTDSKDCFEIIEAFAKRIKTITSQKIQAFAIDGKLYLV
jgi:hypothetical protein